MTADKKPATWKPSTNEPTNQNRRPLITKMNSPSVSKVAGKVSKTSTGRMNVLISPSTSAAISAETIESTLIDDMREGSDNIDAALISQTSRSRMFPTPREPNDRTRCPARRSATVDAARDDTSIAIRLRLVGPLDIDADISRLLVGQLG